MQELHYYPFLKDYCSLNFRLVARPSWEAMGTDLVNQTDCFRVARTAAENLSGHATARWAACSVVAVELCVGCLQKIAAALATVIAVATASQNQII